MFWKKYISVIVLVVLVLVSGCTLQFAPVVSGPTQDPAVALQTEVARALASTEQAETVLANVVANTMAALATNTPEFTFTPSLTSTPTFTFTPSLTNTPSTPRVTVTSNTYCRSGPGEPYDILGAMNVGETADVIGKNASEDTWIIHLPSNPAVTCWLWGGHAAVTGDASGLTVYTPPPTPTPAPAFTFSYEFWGVGPGYQCFRFDVTNTGSTTWQSYTLSLRDVLHGDNGSTSSNNFTDYDDWCGGTVILTDLTQGETGTAMVVMHLMHAASGETFEATLKLCSSDGGAGLCKSKTITFTF